MRSGRFRATLFAAGCMLASTSLHAQMLRPAIGKPLVSARSFLAAHNYAKAMAQVRIADAVGGKSGQETFVIEQMRAAIAQASGDTATAAKTYADMLASGYVPASEKPTLMMAEASIAYSQKNYADVAMWADRYLKAGGTDPTMRNLLISAYFLQGNFAMAAKLQGAQVAAELKAGQKPTETQLQLLYNAQTKMKDSAGALTTMSNLVWYYPKPDYWLNVIDTLRRKPGYADRLNLDLDRLMFQLGLIKTPSDLMEMIELALQVPLPGEAKALTDAGYTQGILGTGADAARHQRLRDLVNKTYASEQPKLAKMEAEAADDHDGNHQALIGEEYCSYGNFDKGIPLILSAIKKGGLRHPEDTKLHLAQAYLKAGQKPKGIATLKTVGGTEGAGDLARLMLLHAAHP